MDGADPRGGASGTEDGSPLAVPARRWPFRVVVLLTVASVLTALAVSIALVAGLGIGRRAAQARGPDEILVLTLASDGALLAVLFALAMRAGLRPRDLGFRRPTRSAIAAAGAVAAGLWLLSIAVNVASVRILGPHPQSLVETFGAHRGPAAYVLDLAASAVVAPIAEETLFRGVVFGGLAQRMPVWAAAVLSALVFALFHGLGVVFPIFVLGVGLAYVYARTGTLWASMTTHSLVNAVSVTVLFARPDQ